MEQHHHLAKVVDRNIRTLLEMRKQIDRQRGLQQRIADAITSWSGSLPFLYFHVAWFAPWILINTGVIPVLAPFDPFPFGLLTMVVSLEAIFLATIVLISQNRLSELAEQRADLDLQVNILAEYEITKILKLVDAIADHLDLREGKDSELEDLKKEISPIEVLQAMDERKREFGLEVNGRP